MKYVSFLIKPVSSLCNLHCPYCFYEDVSKRRETKSYGKMNMEIVETLILRAIEETEENGVLVFAFQGGEPMLAGLEYYEKFVKLVKDKMEGVRLLEKYKVEYNILSVITSQLSKRTEAYYKF